MNRSAKGQVAGAGEEGPLDWTASEAALPLAGRHPSDLRIRSRTGCSVVAVERGDDVLVAFGPDFRFQPDDTVYVCGSSGAVRRFGELFRLPAA